MGNLLSPLASLCLGAVRGWINVARKRKGGIIDDEGNAWTRLPADQLRDQLEDEYQVEVSTRSVQRALKELADRNHLRREQRWKHRYNRDYWYAMPTYEEELNRHRPRTIAGNYQSVQKDRRRPSVTTRATGHVLTTRSNTQFLEQPAVERTTDERQQISRTARTRKETNMWGGQNPLEVVTRACNAYGKTPPGKGFAPIYPEIKKEEFIGYDDEGRCKKKVWIRGAEYEVID